VNKERPSLTIVRRIKASPAKVYAAWTRAELMDRWWGPDGGPVLSAQAGPHVGGRFRVVFQRLDGLTHECKGEYREVVPERKLAFTWEWASTPEQRSLVTVDLRTVPGGAELVFTHAQFDDETTRDDHPWMEQRLRQIGSALRTACRKDVTWNSIASYLARNG
jgi:uncharacterized protein YndB with AHSA1/START domain